MKRAFLALDLDDDARARLVARIEDGKRRTDVPRASFTKPEKLHLTLHFLGVVENSLLAQIAAELPEACAGLTAPHARLSGFAGFPDLSAARSVYAALGDDGGVRTVATAIESMLRALSVPPDPRAFVPHITLARCREPTDMTIWATAPGDDLGDVWFPRCTLYESRQSPGASAYVPIASVTLAR